MGPSIFVILTLIVLGYSVSSVRIVNQGNQALVERLGRYHRKLRPGLTFVVPFLDAIVFEESLRERLLDIPSQKAITADNVAIAADAVVYWKILDLERTYYEVEDIESAIRELVVTTLRSQLGKMQLEQTFASRDEITQALLDQLDEATEPWGAKVTRVEVQSITPPDAVLKSMQQQQAAELRRQATVLEAAGDQEAKVKRAQGTVESLQLLSQVAQDHPNTQELLRFLIAQRYVAANQQIGTSANSRVLFMDPTLVIEDD